MDYYLGSIANEFLTELILTLLPYFGYVFTIVGLF